MIYKEEYMKYQVIQKVLLFVFLCGIVISNIAFSQTEQDIKKYEKIRQKSQELNQRIRDMIGDSNILPEKIFPLIRQLEEITQESPRLYIERLGSVISAYPNNDQGMIFVKNTSHIFDKVVFYHLTINDFGIFDVSCLIECQEIQLKTLLLWQFRHERTDIPHEHNPWRFVPAEVLNDCDPVLRKKYVERLLDIYQNIVLQIDKKYDVESKENKIILNGFVPPDSYKGVYVSGMDMSDVEDKATREAYQKYNEEQQQKIDKINIQLKSRDIRQRFEKDVQTYLIERYSFLPYRTSELEKILIDKKVDAQMTHFVLEAIRKVEREYPDDGFRFWLSKDKMFKTEAKFISANNKEVVIEKRDAKQMTIEITELRQEDQDYVKRQLAPKQEKSNDTPQTP
jgi:hypothetical protein